MTATRLEVSFLHMSSHLMDHFDESLHVLGGDFGKHTVSEIENVTGSACRGERLAKYNRLLEIEEDLAGVSHFAGRGVFP